MEAVVVNCSFPDDQLALWQSTAVLETTNALWVDKSLDDTRHAPLNQPTQSLPKFTWCWFLQRFLSRPVAAAQLYLYTIGLIEHKKSHPRVEVMAALLGLSGVKMDLSRLADSIEGALAEVFVTADRVGSAFASQLPRSHPFNRVLVSSEWHGRLTEILGAEASKASPLMRTSSAVWTDDGAINTSISSLHTARTTASSRTTGV
ncbi:hypothetical protein H310_13975 [Aphanomyces invadans]|uniref:Uncharacterized protein n=1 Tax=Aphanomyces invadans TaxID=157072 RepID=A0A024TBN0_9STRA|nr:hypothetical protein H310_13975 [Aphanomyces invadans]ETV91428.1 hypothetical protein H310_13975 [Aphanomyces invadans]|eukprot:XP_008879880.1 hypothetical protein H310_13975 [Aphanomyces invadans]